ncbi:MAG TPA: D-aminoacylase [Bradyrhizobium sp.]|uniref:N-acyl-D-amino-acid deacylase family protein n=1 Tax=Bradyrhizobium sp. TaxID=376 RepID=UPI002D8040E5|nr:D-aminoacylase [Bradyrhizobium sp.]HET7889611.1 D-aminoacylase [Bradyrhizobium sp.]
MTGRTDTFDLIIRGGTIIDGTRQPRFDADVGVRDGMIAAIGDLSGAQAPVALEARGKIVAPGFIDSHTHDDHALLSEPEMTFKISQGVTTVVTGNCGISLAPLKPDLPRPMPQSLLGAGDPSARTFERFSDYLETLRRTPASVNVAPMVGHTTLRLMTMASLDRAATSEEIAAMRGLLVEALDAGAIGVSTGTYYPPAAMATSEEVIEVCRPIGGTGAVYATHMRNEAEGSVESLKESFEIGRALNAPVVISHHKLVGEANFGKSAVTLPLIDAAMKCQCVALDCYPYAASSTMLHTDEARLRGRIMIAECASHPEHVGRDLADIADEWQVSRLEAARRLQPASAIYFIMNEGDVRNILSFECTMVGSDGLPGGTKPHPRLWGTFPRVLGHYSREVGLFPLETAVWKMSGLTAKNFGLAKRGTIALGQHADITVFDAATVIDKATYDTPTEPADGIESVIVNGALTWHQGAHSGARRGQVISRIKADAQGHRA